MKTYSFFVGKDNVKREYTAESLFRKHFQSALDEQQKADLHDELSDAGMDLAKHHQRRAAIEAQLANAAAQMYRGEEGVIKTDR